jgi:uncharacterized MAPEG superfamily protein
MTTDLKLLAYSTMLTWLMLMTASALRWRWWTPRGFSRAIGNRDEAAESSPAAGRADRAARNMLENLVLFASLLLTAHAGGAGEARVELGSQLFFWARVAYFPVYVLGIPYLRTAIWSLGVAGLALIFTAML